MAALVRALVGMAKRAPVTVVVVAVGLTAVFGMLSANQELDAGQESFSPDNEELDALNFAGQAFGGSSDTTMQVLIEGGDVVSPDGLRTVQAVREAVQEAVDPTQLGGQGQGPLLSYLAPVEAALAQTGGPPPGDDAGVDELYETGLSVLPPEVAGVAQRLVNDGVDADKGLLLVALNTDAITGDAPEDEALERIIDVEQAVATAVADRDTPLQATAFGFELLFEPDDTFTDEVGRLFGMAALVILLVLLLVYRAEPRGRLSWLRSARRAGADVLLTLFTIVASITWMQGIGVLLGPDYLGLIGAFSPPTQIIPILLIGLGVDYAIHLTSRYREELGDGAGVDVAMTRAVGTVGIALTLATITTALGFLTNLANPIPAVADFGVLAAIGIGTAFLLMLTFVPSIRLLLDRRAERTGRLPRESFAVSGESALSRLMARASVFAEHAPAMVLSVTIVLGGVGAYGLTQLSTEFSFADFLPADSPLKGAIETLEEDFGGGFGEQTQVVIRGDVARPEVHNATVSAQQDLADTPGVVTFGGEPAVTSPARILSELQRAAADAGGSAEGLGGGPAGGIDPAAAAAVLEAATAEGLGPDGTFPPGADVAAVYRTMLERLPGQAGAVLATADGEIVAAKAVITSQSSDVGAVTLADGVEEDFAPVAATGPSVVATSNEIVSEVIVGELSGSQVSSLAITMLAALLLLVTVFGVREGRPGLGAITLAPVVLVVLWVFGTMAATGIPFGPVTAMISALAIGIGVPFTIHVSHRFSEDLGRQPSIDDALRSTLRHTGGALAGSAVTTMAGFAILVTSSLVPFRQLGLVTAYAIGYALLAAVLVLPSLLALWARWHHRRGEPAAPAHEGRELTPAH